MSTPNPIPFNPGTLSALDLIRHAETLQTLFQACINGLNPEALGAMVATALRNEQSR